MKIPFIALRGAVWYQGEADAGWEPSRYGERLRVMIEANLGNEERLPASPFEASR